MKILYLPLKKQWYEMIECGEKTEESTIPLYPVMWIEHLPASTLRQGRSGCETSLPAGAIPRSSCQPTVRRFLRL